RPSRRAIVDRPAVQARGPSALLDVVHPIVQSDCCRLTPTRGLLDNDGFRDVPRDLMDDELEASAVEDAVMLIGRCDLHTHGRRIEGRHLLQVLHEQDSRDWSHTPLLYSSGS